ncbi:ATP-binding protein [Actinomycetospora cinnamomea]|uniref:ATP-binding protein n=1 Tax=Actinomycetospora cinnamomea TaxID=663609 RepID=UPI0024341BB2|nr:ATP-binding protein [Actinomycetospora cinnamomea]
MPARKADVVDGGRWHGDRDWRHQPRDLRHDLVLIDEIGFAPLDDTAAQLLFRLVAAAYERRSLAVSSHWPFDQWGRLLPEHTTAVSLLDRLLHHAHVVVTDGESYRMRQARAKGAPGRQQLNNPKDGGLSPGHQRGPRTGR